MMEVQGRVLPTPRLAYGGDTHMDPGHKREWNLMNQRWVAEVGAEVGGVRAVVCWSSVTGSYHA